MADPLDIDLRGDIDGSAPAKRGPGWFEEVVKGWGPPVLLVLVLRSILIEPFQIPSGSMVPTLAIGDFILVSKFGYGLRVPFTNTEILPLGEPERGDVVVFVKPDSVSEDPLCWVKRIPRTFTFDMVDAMPGPRNPCSIDFIKRIVGLPGDTVEVRDNVLYVNGERQERQPAGPYSYPDPARSFRRAGGRCETVENAMFTETLGSVEHPVLQSADYVLRVSDTPPTTVPEGQYFMMGDNRDNSQDSRFWGFVPREMIRGKAMFVWLSFDPCEDGFPGLGRLRTERIGHGLK